MDYIRHVYNSIFKIDKQKLILNFVLIPFLCPRGFTFYFWEYTWFFTSWLYLAVVVILLEVLLIFRTERRGKLRKMSCVNWLMCYFFVMALITFLVRFSFLGGLRKIFSTAALILFSEIWLHREPWKFINQVNWLLMIIFLLALSVFHPHFWAKYFGNSMTFLGHIQVSAQFGLVSFFFAYLDYALYTKKKSKYIFQVILSVLVMIQSGTAASSLALMILFVCWWLGRLKTVKLQFINGLTYEIVYFLLNILFFIYALKGEYLNIFSALNGREYIWKEAIESFFGSPIYGYGVHGVLIKVFWSQWVGDGNGMDYLHNQTLQVLNDGGIILFFFFAIMLYVLLANLNKIADIRIRFWATVYMLIILLLMIFDSLLDFPYIFFIFMGVVYLPEMTRKREISMQQL